MSVSKIYEETKIVFKELLKENKKFRDLNICVISCSISKVEGKKIDTIGDKNLAQDICRALWDMKPKNLNFAVQCCEHLNRALIIERDLKEGLNLEQVSAYPVDKAGGTFATAAYKYFKDPVLVESIKADGGIDIGLNLIGMNLKSVAQPLVMKNEYIGKARVVCARTRLKLIGGERAVYNME
ncbi:MAG: TIGR01440 family protein [Clostridium botulinum]|nr:TIGR01440 family protein [Clostridium botulinum]